MNVGGFLKKVGDVIVKGVEVWTGFEPIIASALPGTAGAAVQVVSKDLAEISNLVITAEAIGQASGLAGPAKAAAVGPLIGQLVVQTAPFLDKKIGDPVKFQAAMVTIAGGFADAWSAVDDGAVQTAPL